MAGLRDFPAGAVLRAEDLARARDFYTRVLGLEPVATRAELTDEVTLAAGDCTTVTIYSRPGMPAPQNTVLSFAIPAASFDAVVAELKAAGVRFEDYDIPEMGLVTHEGILESDGSKAAWFLDTEGNIIGIGTM